MATTSCTLSAERRVVMAKDIFKTDFCKITKFSCTCGRTYINTSNCKQCTCGNEKQTNADRIRSMSDEELAEFIEEIVSGNRNVIGINCGNSKCESWKCTECISMWLQSEVE